MGIPFGFFFSLSILFFLTSGPVRAETYDWLRSSVNEFWYNQFVGECPKTMGPIDLSSLSKTAASCSRKPESVHVNRRLSKDLVADTYFDEALVETAKQNQCQFDYWSALSARDGNYYATQKNANKKLGTQFEVLKQGLPSPEFSAGGTVQALAAQSKVVDQLVQAAAKIATKRRELKHFMAQNPIYTPDPKKSSRVQVEKLVNELSILENSFLLSEDEQVRNFVMFEIIPKINDSFAIGQKPNLEELKSYYLNDKKNGFQAKVVDKKLESISKEQTEYADIDGNYNANYTFKVNAVQSGVGAKILNEKAKQNLNFSRLQCEMDSKYGKGEEVANTAHSVIIGGVTIAFGGGAMLMGRLAQLGITSQRAARIAQAIATVTNSTISASEIAQGLVVSCRQPHFLKKDSSICERVNSVKENGIDVQMNFEIDHTDCLTDLGLAALSGGFAFKTAANARRLKRDQQLLQLGLKERYNSLLGQIKTDASLSAAQKKALVDEINKSVSLSDLEKFPRAEFLAVLAKEDSTDLLSALKQINTETGGGTWSEKVKTWISTKGFNKKEAEQLESCMIDNAAKTSTCLAIPRDTKT